MLEQIKKYNLWDGNKVPTGFQRTAYLDRVGAYAGNKLVKVLVGQRRSGKSYLLRQLASRMVAQGDVSANNTLFINMEYLDYSPLTDYRDLEQLYQEFRSNIAGEGRICLFIDEIQNVKQWERFVNSHAQDFTEQCEIFITGSNSSLLAGELATLLSGRYVQFEVAPYSFEEYCGVKALPVGREAYISYLHEGALPEMQVLPDDDMRRSYMQSIRDTVMLRDIVVRYKVKDAPLLNDIFTFVVNNASSLISITNVVNYFKSRGRKTNYETVSTYMGYLENAFLVHKAVRYNVRGKEAISGAAKYYVNDLGFHNYLYRGVGYGEGYLLENAIYMQLRRRGYDIYVGQIDRKEVDFVAIHDDERLYVQVALQISSPETYEREYSPLRLIADHYRKLVVTLDPYRLPSDNGIEHLFPWEL